jgi:hypothetical protein
MPDDHLDDLLRELRSVADPDGPGDDAERRLVARLDRTLGAQDRSLRAGFRNARRAVLAIVAAAGIAAGAAGGAAVALAAGGTGAPGTAQGGELRADPANPSRVAYAAVERSTVRPTGRTRVLLGVLARRFPDVDLAAARGIEAADGTRGWVVPGRKHTCFGAENDDGTGYTCVSNARARLGALSTAAVSPDGRIRAIYLVPDGVDRLEADGRTFRPRGNLVVATYGEDAPVTIVTGSGTTTTIEGRP